MKKNKKIAIIIITLYLIILIPSNIIIRNIYDSVENQIHATIIYGKENHEDLFASLKGIENYTRALTFYKGEDNDIFSTPEKIIKENGEEQIISNSGMYSWEKLSDVDNIILAFSSSTCDTTLSDNEIIIYQSNDGLDSSIINQEISLKYNGELLTFTIKDIKTDGLYPHICISEELYEKLLPNEENYIYDIKTKNYKTHTYIAENWQNLENNDFYTISVPGVTPNLEYSFKENRISDLVDTLNVINLLTIVILIIFIIYLIIKKLTESLNKEE